ncbi:hypothetical protein DFA_05904 [Cavenderia fasciculata]|uniref:Uncharacterized protein n=1 Tax=Cavenderia fasciculata TaxID=261658 RepID=F4PJJ5_CACFS|nr:uncharacterized protein DFA_05904 [Cavenderia fasciculata]EGG23769.1 hypothetical protein DFA_05904 [Cavenderia fasciculata]|eukprot:XP_004361620.1 hypothetical protein DFA_05904 [Cavenderia fasciculata]
MKSDNEDYTETQSIFVIDDSTLINEDKSNGDIRVGGGGETTDNGADTYKFYHIKSLSLDNDDGDEISTTTGDHMTSKVDRFPPSIKYLIGNEISESHNQATSALHTFSFVTYFFPILMGAYLADGVIGKYKTILCFCIVYCFGCITLWMSSSSRIVGDNPETRSSWALGIGLLLVATGTGGIKPVALTFCGDQLDAKRQAPLVEKLYTLFYWSINVGSFGGTILSPICRAYLGYEIAFAIPCLFMFMATIFLLLGRKQYKRRPITGSILLTSFGIILRGIWERCKSLVGKASQAQSHYNGHWLDRSKSTFDNNSVESVKACLNVLVCFIPIPFYRAMGELFPSRWTLQALSMNRKIGIFTVQPDQLQVLNPLILLAIIPLSEVLVYRPLRNKGIPFHPLKKMSIGMFTSIIGFLVCVGLQIHIDNSPKESVSVFLQIPQYFIMAIAELLVTVPGLEFAYSHAPASHKSLIMSGWLIAISLGNLFVVLVVDGFQIAVQWHEYLFFAGCTLIFSFVFVFIAYRFKPSSASIINYQADHDEFELDQDDELFDNSNNGVQMKERITSIATEEPQDGDDHLRSSNDGGSILTDSSSSILGNVGGNSKNNQSRYTLLNHHHQK